MLKIYFLSCSLDGPNFTLLKAFFKLLNTIPYKLEDGTSYHANCHVEEELKFNYIVH
jgi:hypothetical protein